MAFSGEDSTTCATRPQTKALHICSRQTVLQVSGKPLRIAISGDGDWPRGAHRVELGGWPPERDDARAQLLVHDARHWGHRQWLRMRVHSNAELTLNFPSNFFGQDLANDSGKYLLPSQPRRCRE